MLIRHSPRLPADVSILELRTESLPGNKQTELKTSGELFLFLKDMKGDLEAKKPAGGERKFSSPFSLLKIFECIFSSRGACDRF